MRRIYTLPGFWWRNNGSMAALVVVALWGVWELWRAAAEPSDQSTQGYLFGLAFLGGPAYALWQLTNDARDRVATFDLVSASGRSMGALWRPFWIGKLEADRDATGEERVHVDIRQRNSRPYFLHPHHHAY